MKFVIDLSLLNLRIKDCNQTNNYKKILFEIKRYQIFEAYIYFSKEVQNYLFSIKYKQLNDIEEIYKAINRLNFFIEIIENNYNNQPENKNNN